MINQILKQVQGWVKLKGDTDGTKIGNTGDKLRVETTPAHNHHLDAFGRFRTSESQNIWDYTFRDNFDFDAYWDTDLTGSATTQQINQRVVREIAITATSGDKAILQSRRHMEYTPGISHTMKYTANFKGAQANVRKRHGLFDANNGVFFEADGTTLYVVIRSDISGSVVDTRVAQSNWNGDKLDGTGESGHTANPEYKYLFWIDLAWLSIGRVRLGVYIGGKKVEMHTFTHSGLQAESYMASCILPFRSEIEATGTPSSADSMELTCCSYEIEGGKNGVGRIRSLASEYTTEGITSTPEIIAHFRINPNAPYCSMKLMETLLTVTSGNSTVHWEIFQNATITGTPTWTDADNSAIQYANNVGSLTFSGGFMIIDGYARVDDDSQGKANESDIYLGRDIAGNSDTFTLVAGTLSSSSQIVWVQTWKEFR